MPAVACSSMKLSYFSILAVFSTFTCAFTYSKPIPENVQDILENYCLDCHDEDLQKGEILLERKLIDWKSKENLFLWERVMNALESGEMPPKKKTQPSSDERKSMIAWIDQELKGNTSIGGTLARRLNQAEYKASIKSLFGLKDFQLPQGFPSDQEHHGFDNLGEGLVLSPPLMESYAKSGSLVADEIFAPKRKVAKFSINKAEAKDLVISYSSSKIVDGAMRLGMSCKPLHRSCTWPSRIEIETSGLYMIKVVLSSFRPLKGAPPMLTKILARDVASSDGVANTTLRVLEEFEVNSESPKSFEFKAELFEGQTVVFHWANAPFRSDREAKNELRAFFLEKNEKHPKYLAAWDAMIRKANGQGFRGGIGWERVKALLVRDDLQALDGKKQEAVLKKILSNPVLYAETVVFDVFENGPSLQIHGLEIQGPHKVIEGPLDKEQERRKKSFFGENTVPEKVIENFLTKAFRRPVDQESVQAYLSLHDRHIEEGHSKDDAMHLVIRKALMSPRFLYRSLTEGPLDDYDLATRLSYFLTGEPPDSKLLVKAASGKLSDPAILKKEAERLLPNKASAPMLVNFTGQWLDTRLLKDIMPDPSFDFQPNDEKNIKLEVEYFFFEMLKDNRPMTDFINPDFTWTSARIANNLYGLTTGFDKKKNNVVHRVKLNRNGRYGGILANAAVMMATANGVDTQPVTRGVWVLENVLGMPPPPPPNSVPALTPDTQGATTPRDLLSAHTSATSCAGCHRKIDPVGFVLENFDPVGKWREKWPVIDRQIDASSTLQDGTEIKDYLDFKIWLVQNVDLFSECLAKKLLTYATGRVLNYSERQEIKEIVASNKKNANGFRDLLLALIDSQSFRLK